MKRETCIVLSVTVKEGIKKWVFKLTFSLSKFFFVCLKVKLYSSKVKNNNNKKCQLLEKNSFTILCVRCVSKGSLP